MAFQTSLSGLAAAQSNLGVTGNNIANSSTTGFKKSRAEFADVYAASIFGTASTAIGGGVKVSSVAQQHLQGNIEFTDNPLDLAVSGEGFFRLDDNGTTTFSRAGMFKVDKEGDLVNSTGQRLTGYQADATGNITGSLGLLNISTANISPSATGALVAPSGVVASMNLDSNAAIPTGTMLATTTTPTPDMYNNSTSLTSYDTLGNPILTTMYFGKSAPNVWNVHTVMSYTDAAGTVTQEVLVPQGGVFPAQITFSNTGAVAGVTPAFAGNILDYNAMGAGAGSIAGATGAAPLDFEIDVSAATQFGGGFAVNSLVQDGFASGQLSGIDIGDTGVVFARYSNGQSRPLGQVALANFANPQGLQPLGDTIWAETFDSGQPLVGQPGTSSLGLIQSGALESSNVDISKELVNMIVAQRDFQANAKMISTEDQITQAIINIR